MKTYNAIYKYGHLYDTATNRRILLKENAEIALVIQSSERDLYTIDPKNDPNDDENKPRETDVLKKLVEAEQYHHFEKILDRNQHLYFTIKAGNKDENGKRRYECCFRVTLLEELYMVWKTKDTKQGEFFFKKNRSCSCVVDRIEFGELDPRYFEPIYGSSLSDVYTLTYEMYFSRFGRSGVNIYKFLTFEPGEVGEPMKEENVLSSDVTYRSSQFPVLYDYFLLHKDKLSARNQAEIGIRYEWYALQRCAASYWQLFDEPKIIWGELSDEAKFTFDDEGHYVEAITFMMTGTSLKFLLGVLNSKVAQWYFEQITTTSGMGTNRWKKYKIEQLPVPNEQEESQIETLVNQILSDKRNAARKAGKNTEALEAEVDALVYELYGLTEAEIAVVEGRG